MDSLDNEYFVEERLPILLSGVGGVKLLGVPTLPYKSTEKAGPLIAEATRNLLEEWDCAENVTGMVFDTTVSNTGTITVVCISVKSDLKRYLLWLACRHHIGEVLLNSVWDSLKIEVSKSPNVSLFTRFKENYKAVQYTDMDDLEIPAILPALEAKRDSIVQLCHEAIKIGFVRGDYKELVLLLCYISETMNHVLRGLRGLGPYTKLAGCQKYYTQ